MKMTRLQSTIALWAGICLFLAVMIIVGYASFAMYTKAERDREEAITHAQEYAATLAREHVNRIRMKLEIALNTARTLARTFSGVKDEQIELDLDRDEVNGILESTLANNPDFVGIGTAWEPNAFDQMDLGYAGEKGHDDTGRFIPYWNRNGEGNIELEPLTGYDDEHAGIYYWLPKQTGKECIIEPQLYSVQGENMLMTTLTVPILVSDTFYGMVRVDLLLESFQELVDDVTGFYGGNTEMFIISHQGTVAAATGQPEIAGTSIETLWERWEEYTELIQHGEMIVREEQERLAVFAPLTIGKSTTPWSVDIFVPMKNITAEADMEKREAFYDLYRMLALSGVCAGIALIMLWFLARTITSPIVKSVDVAKKLAAGDLDIEIQVTRTHEIGQLQRAMQDMLAQLKGVVTSGQTTARQVVVGSQAMSSSSTQISQAASEQAAAAEEASSSMEQMASNISQNTENALQTEKIAMKAAEDARQSGHAVAEAVEAMREIAKRVSLIEDITRQTRLLSLNATIEAARAQEYGRGFAVVAAEVRTLAERSQAAATEINTLTSSSVGIAEKAGNMLQKLVPDIQKTAELVQEISAASKEQYAGAEQINRAIQQLDRVTQQNSASSEELSAMAEEFASQAEQLQNTMAFFQIAEVERNADI